MFRIDRNQSIFITRGDTANLDIRIFNKSWHMLPEPAQKWVKPKVYPLMPLVNSEGTDFLFDSEGYPIYIDSEGHINVPNWDWPLYVIPKDSEGNLLVKPPVPVELPPWPKLHKYPKWRQVEEIIKPWDLITLRVKDIETGEIVLEKTNDEAPDTIFLLKADTAELKPKQYLYQLRYEPFIYGLDSEDTEENTVVDGLFEILEKF